MWGLLICVAVVAIAWLAGIFEERRRRANIPRRDKHFFEFPCLICELESLKSEKLKDEKSRSSTSREYWSIPDAERQRLRALAEEHIQNNDIPTLAGSIEVAVVNMWRKSRDSGK